MTDSVLNTETTSQVATDSAPEASKIETTTESRSISLSELLPEDVLSQGNLKDFKTPVDLAQSYVNLQRMVGNSVRIPPADATAEAKKEFLSKIKDVEGIILKEDPDVWHKIGKPKTAAEYQLEDLLPSSVTLETPGVANEIENFKKTAHELNLTNEQARKIAESKLKELSMHQELSRKKFDECVETLKKEWGADYENRVNAAKNIAKVFTDKYGPAMKELINSPAANNPAFAQILNELAVAYKEKGHVGMQKTHFGMTPEDAKRKIADRKADTGFMQRYMNSTHPEHKIAVEELSALYELAHLKG